MRPWNVVRLFLALLLLYVSFRGEPDNAVGAAIGAGVLTICIVEFAINRRS